MMIETECMDNFEFHYVGTRNFKEVISLALAKHTSAKAWEEKDGWLIFYWYTTVCSYPFPVPLKTDALQEFIIEWLRAQDLGSQPDLDGSCSKGYELLVDPYNTSSYEVFRVRPVWAEHHK